MAKCRKQRNRHQLKNLPHQPRKRYVSLTNEVNLSINVQNAHVFVLFRISSQVKATAAEAKATKAAPAKATKAAPAKATKETPVKATKAAPAKKAGAVDAYLLFEVCKSCHTYKRTANQVFADICAAFPKKHFEIVINEHGLSRRGSFEVTVSKKKGSTASAQLIWSGISKGPPRKLKFPDAAQLIESVKSAV